MLIVHVIEDMTFRDLVVDRRIDKSNCIIHAYYPHEKRVDFIRELFLANQNKTVELIILSSVWNDISLWLMADAHKVINYTMQEEILKYKTNEQ